MKSKVFIVTATAIIGFVVFLLFTLSPDVAFDRPGMETKKKVDIHAHFHSPVILEAIERITGEREGFGWTRLKFQNPTYFQTFTIEERLEWMDQFGIKKSVFSFASAYLFMRDEQNQVSERQAIAQFVNNYFAEVHQKYPGRAFFMANVALSVANTEENIDWSVQELRRAIEGLGLQAVCIPTNVGWTQLSDPVFEPFFDEVERLGIPLFIHPESPYCMEEMMAYGMFGKVGFPNDMALMIGTFIFSGFMDQRQDLKIILTHLGGSLPYFYARLDIGSPPVLPMPKKPSEYLKKFYYDTAIGNPLALKYLIEFLGSGDRILFGTDHPWVDSAEANTIDYIQKTSLTKKERKKIYFKNAENLFGIE